MISYQFGKLRQTFGDFGNIFHLYQIFRFKHVHNTVTSDLSYDSFDSVQCRVLIIEERNVTLTLTDGAFSTHHAPVIVNLVQSHRVEHNAGHYFRQNRPVLDEPVVVRGGLLVDDAHDPLQHLPLQLQVFLKRKENMNVD